jgi:hypothetical protein
LPFLLDCVGSYQAWKSLQLGVLTLWNACARNAAMERHAAERGIGGRLLSIVHSPSWPPSLREIAAGCLEFFMERLVTSVTGFERLLWDPSLCGVQW